MAQALLNGKLEGIVVRDSFSFVENGVGAVADERGTQVGITSGWSVVGFAGPNKCGHLVAVRGSLAIVRGGVFRRRRREDCRVIDLGVGVTGRAPFSQDAGAGLFVDERGDYGKRLEANWREAGMWAAK